MIITSRFDACFMCLHELKRLRPAEDKHHIVYGLEHELTVPLCRDHHLDITALNTACANLVAVPDGPRKLTPSERGFIWSQFMDGVPPKKIVKHCSEECDVTKEATDSIWSAACARVLGRFSVSCLRLGKFAEYVVDKGFSRWNLGASE